METIGGDLFTINPKNLNRFHKESNNILSVIIILGTNFHGGETYFYDGVYINGIRKRAHFLNHSHELCVVGAFETISNEGSIWTGHRAVIYFIIHKSICIQSLHHGTIFYDKYIISDDRKKYMDDDGSGVFPKLKVGKPYN